MSCVVRSVLAGLALVFFAASPALATSPPPAQEREVEGKKKARQDEKGQQEREPPGKTPPGKKPPAKETPPVRPAVGGATGGAAGSMVPSKITPEAAAKNKKILALLSRAVTDLQSGTLGIEAMRAYLEHRKVQIGDSALASFTSALQSAFSDGTLTAERARQSMISLRQDVAGRYVSSERLATGPTAMTRLFKNVPPAKIEALASSYGVVLEDTRRLQIEERLSDTQRSAVQALRARVEVVGGDGEPVDTEAHGAELVSIWLEGIEDQEGRGAAVAERLDAMRAKGELDGRRYVDVVAEIAAWLHAPQRKTMDASGRELELRQLLSLAGLPDDQARQTGKFIRGFVGATLKARKES